MKDFGVSQKIFKISRKNFKISRKEFEENLFRAPRDFGYLSYDFVAVGMILKYCKKNLETFIFPPQDGKGNSLFSEVEDRRQKVEEQFATLSSRYDKVLLVMYKDRNTRGPHMNYSIPDPTYMVK